MKKSIRARAFAPALSVLSLAVAAAVQVQAQELNPVVVVSNRVNEQLSDALPSVSVIQKSDIEKFRYSDLYELLSGQPGMQLSRSGGTGNPTSVFMRGANSTQTLVLVDGIPFASQGAIGASSPLEAIPLAHVERVEILRGNASSVYGPGAAGGVIQIFTQSPTVSTEGVDAKVDVGSMNSRALQTSIRKNLEEGKKNIEGYLKNYSPLSGVYVNGNIGNIQLKKMQLTNQAILAYLKIDGEVKIRVDGLK